MWARPVWDCQACAHGDTASDVAVPLRTAGASTLPSNCPCVCPSGWFLQSPEPRTYMVQATEHAPQVFLALPETELICVFLGCVVFPLANDTLFLCELPEV